MARQIHSKKDVRDAIKELQNAGWEYTQGSGKGHSVGFLSCPWKVATNQSNTNCHNGQNCRRSISGSPRNPGTLANQMRGWMRACINPKIPNEE